MSQKPERNTAVKKLLIIDDEGTICLLLNLLLDGHGLELDHVPTMLEAEAHLKNGQPDLVILDNKLPDGFGVDFIPFLKSKYPDIRVIMISGLGSAVKDVALENGADIFLEKPFGRDDIIKAVDKLLIPSSNFSPGLP
jgi:DNA-binding response OmpR family regulator